MSEPNVLISGDTLVTADGVLGTSGAATRVFNMHILSGAGGGGTVALRNGTAVSDTIRIQETGIVSQGVTFDYGDKGHLFPNGCYVDVDANTTSVLISWSQ